MRDHARPGRSLRPARLLPALLALLLAGPLALEPPVAAAQEAGVVGGPYERLVIRGATLIDGTGAPPVGPVDIVVEGDRIVEIRRVGNPLTGPRPEGRAGRVGRSPSGVQLDKQARPG